MTAGLLEHEPKTLDEYLAAGGGEGILRALARTPEEVIEEVAASGLRGRGGAGFPTGDKWRSVRTVGSGTRFTVCNAAEGEPATFKDRLLMRRNPYQVLEGLAIAAYAVGAEAAFVGLKEAFVPEIEAMNRALGEMARAGMLGGLAIQMVLGPDHYLFGEETGLLEVIEGRDPLPRVLAPYIMGLYASPNSENPTAANNVETLANVPWILAHGPEWLRASGTADSPGTMVFTICGDVQREGCFELPLGTPLRRLVEDMAGGPPGPRSIKAIFPGASNTALTPAQFDTPMDFGSMRAVGSALGSAGFMVFDDSACMVKAAHQFSRFLYVESCAQCPPCKFGSEAITALLEKLERGRGASGMVETMLARAKTVTDGQKCALPTGESLLIQSVVQLFRREFVEHEVRGCPSPRELVFPKIVDQDEETGRFVYDELYASKQPDWMYAP